MVAGSVCSRAASTSARKGCHRSRTWSSRALAAAEAAGTATCGPEGFRVSGASPPRARAAWVCSKTEMLARTALAVTAGSMSLPSPDEAERASSSSQSSLVIFWSSMRCRPARLMHRPSSSWLAEMIQVAANMPAAMRNSNRRDR